MHAHPPWLTVRRGAAPLLLSMPHTGTEIPAALEPRFMSPWLARKDADWWIELLYDFAVDLDASIVRTSISRSVIDVNRDPSGASLYPGQATTGLCPSETFDGEALYRNGTAPGAPEIAERRAAYFDPYHDAVAAEIARLREKHQKIVLYDCHSIRSAIPRLFEGTLPTFNIGTNSGASCDPALADAVAAHCAASGMGYVVNGRFKGGYITRAYGKPDKGVHAVQMELACRSYLPEPEGPPEPTTWPPAYDAAYAAPVRASLREILAACVRFSSSPFSKGTP